MAEAKVKEQAVAPSSPWVVDWADNYCTLARKFSGDGKDLVLSMKAYSPGYGVEITLVGAQVSLLDGPAAWTIAYGSGEPIRTWGQVGKVPEVGPSITFLSNLQMHAPKDFSGVSDDERERETIAMEKAPYPDAPFEAQLDRITIGTPYRNIVLQTGPMAKALTTLRQCTDNLVKSWSLDPAVQASRSRHAQLADTAWIRKVVANYPVELRFRGMGARVSLRIMVDRTGKPTSCHPVQTFANTAFDVKACDIAMKDASFHPALDKDGQPVDSYYMTAVVYKLS